ncbi:MAG: amine dehydrogenase, partial [Gammaproteobacteria bacterium]
MRSAPLRSAATLCLTLSVLAHAAPPPLPAEHLTVQQLPPKSPHWVYVYDEAFNNEIDARVHLFDGDSY